MIQFRINERLRYAIGKKGNAKMYIGLFRGYDPENHPEAPYKIMMGKIGETFWAPEWSIAKEHI